jgi:DNA repair protein RecO (recombination protein O)
VPAKTESTDALLLRAVDYAESDRIVTLLTSRFGKASFIARGARRSKKRFGGALQPLHLLRVELSKGKGELGSLLQAQITRSFPRILTDLGRMGAGFAATEWVRELLPEHEVELAVWEACSGLLAALEAPRASPSRLLLCFEVRLLTLLGFAPQLEHCGLCGREPAPAQGAAFDAREGYLVCQRCGGAPHYLGGGLRSGLIAAAGAEWLAAADETWQKSQVQQAHAALRALAEHRIGKALDADGLLQTAMLNA